MALTMTDEAFDDLVDAALEQIPDELLGMIENAALIVEDASPPGMPPLFGLYQGVPLTERDSHYSAVLPDRIYIYRQTILAACWTYEDAVEEVAVTVVHEIAHHFGISDEVLHELGWG